jgi:hypothetical protein
VHTLARATPGGNERIAVTAPGETGETAGTPRLAILLAMAMFVLVVDASLMNVLLHGSSGSP